MTACTDQIAFSDEEKLAELDREIDMRRRVYGWQVRNGKLSPEMARRQMDLMLAIKSDYVAKLKAVH